VLEQHQGDYPGAPHGAETSYVFGTLDELRRTAGPDRPGLMGYRVTQADRAYGELIARYWVNFARYSNPNSDGLPGWPALTANDDLILEFNQQQPEVKRNLLAERWAFFKKHFDAGRL
jgi:carboxylesterase type B